MDKLFLTYILNGSHNGMYLLCKTEDDGEFLNLDDKFIYVRLEDFWSYKKQFKLVFELKEFVSVRKVSWETRHYFSCESSNLTYQLAMRYLGPYLEEQKLKDFKHHMFDIKVDEVTINPDGKNNYIQLYFLKAINYLDYLHYNSWHYDYDLPSDKQKQIFILDEERILFNSIHMVIRRIRSYENDKRKNPPKFPDYNYPRRYSDTADDEDDIMGALGSGEGDVYGF